jgi:hypothetical protein
MARKRRSAPASIESLVARLRSENHGLAAPAKKSEIKGAERALGFKLPADYVEFLGHANGAFLFPREPDSIDAAFRIVPVSWLAGDAKILRGMRESAPRSWAPFVQYGSDYLVFELEAEKPWVLDFPHDGGEHDVFWSSFSDFLEEALDSRGDLFWLRRGHRRFGNAFDLREALILEPKRAAKRKKPEKKPSKKAPPPRPARRALETLPAAARSVANAALPEGALLRLGVERPMFWVPTKRDVKANAWHLRMVRSLAFAGDLLVTASDDSVRVWDGNGASRGGWSSTRLEIGEVAVSPRGHVAFVEAGRTIRVFSIATSGSVTTIKGKGVNGIAFSPDGKLLGFVSGYEECSWDLERGKARKGDVERLSTRRLLLEYTGAPKLCDGDDDDDDEWRLPARWPAALSPDERFIAAALGEAAIGIFSVPRKKLLVRLEGHRDEVTALAFSADGTRLASSGGERTVIVWDLAAITGKKKRSR